MLAVTFDKFGGSDVLQIMKRPMPIPSAGEVVVKVAAATVNPTDIMMRSGAQAKLMTALVPPYTAGMEFSGHVHAVGTGVELLPGTPVMGVVNPRRPEGGAQAEYVVVPAASVAALHEGVDLIAAATIPMNGLTAVLALEMLDLVPGQVLLVTGGAGMLGGSTIQLARARGLRVIANVGEDKAARVKALGANVIVPRDAGMAEAIRAACPGGVDGLIDGALIGQNISGLVREGGGAIALRGSHPIEDKRLNTHVVSVAKGFERSDVLADLSKMLGDGNLRPRLAPDGRIPFRNAAIAYDATEAGKLDGRAVLIF